MNELNLHKLSKSELKEINEKDVMFITNPGRMGDEDGLTFIMRQDKELTIYRVDGLLYGRRGEKVDITLADLEKQFPKWLDTWKQNKEKNDKGKYEYLYMGFGNGLCVDHSIYKDYINYLDSLVEKCLENSDKEEKESLKYAAIFNVWKEAVILMAKEKGYILK